MNSIKRNTTPNIVVEIEDVNMDDVTEVRFAFKAINEETAPELFPEKKYTKAKNPEHFFKMDDKHFTVNLKLEAEETMKIPKGQVYIDVLPIAGEEILDAGDPLCFEVRGTYFKEVK
ncbi:MAG: hypothetical protein IKY78_00090 [Clostridia bacterium]|nr:hypothetical protein [Clostridia bacterium]